MTSTIVFHRYRAHFYVHNDVGVIARMTIMLRKFGVNIQSFDVSLKEGMSQFSNLTLDLESTKDENGMALVMKKMERLIPVIKAECVKRPEDDVAVARSEVERFDF